MDTLLLEHLAALSHGKALIVGDEGEHALGSRLRVARRVCHIDVTPRAVEVNKSTKTNRCVPETSFSYSSRIYIRAFTEMRPGSRLFQNAVRSPDTGTPRQLPRKQKHDRYEGGFR